MAALPLIEKWIAFATVSRDSNLALLDWTEAYLNDLGISCSRTYDDSGQKANLWATLPAHDGETKVGGLVLSGHTDVVPPRCARQERSRIHPVCQGEPGQDELCHSRCGQCHALGHGLFHGSGGH